MRCRFSYCDPARHPAIGLAMLRGKEGCVTQGTYGQYPLCQFHYTQARNGTWESVTLEGWEPLPITIESAKSDGS